MGAISITTLLMLALLLPGIAFVVSAFQASWQDEITPDPPSLTSANGIVVAGGASLAIHLIWSQLLIVNANLPPLIGMEPANPYIFLTGELATLRSPAKIYGLISGLTLTTFLGAALGRLLAWAALRYDKSEYFYGPLAKLLKLAAGKQRFINAYVLSRRRGQIG